MISGIRMAQTLLEESIIPHHVDLMNSAAKKLKEQSL